MLVACDLLHVGRSRVKFMLETISALRTNNTRKIPNHDPTLLEHMKRVLRGLLRSAGMCVGGGGGAWQVTKFTVMF